ncbi:MAG TPA: DNA polymerase III subunit beta [Alphaproteobacteria bacterium]|nr:DNA polymerase III subunit beta [Alphaproteobacteria bacterium]
MKVVLERNALLKTLGHVQSVVEKRNTIPILANVLIRAEKNGVSFTATDMDLEMNEKVAGDVGKPGARTAPAHTLYDIVRKLPDGAQVELSAGESGNQLSLSSGRSNFKLGCLPIDDFPQMAEGDLQHRFTLSSADLKTIIDRTRFAMSMEETRYYLNGIFLHTAKAKGDVNVLRAVATDGHRLARLEMPAPREASGIAGVILPRKTVTEVRKLLDEVSGDITIALSSSKVRFSLEHIVVTSKLIDGTFPDYERVIPTGNDKMLELDAKVLASAVDRVATISSEKSRAIKLALAKNTLTLSASSPDAGSAVEEIEVSYKGEPIEIGFNARYLLDILSQVEGSGARFMMADAASPTIVQDGSDASALYVLMPMRV